ncbi:hypothetical protein HOY82DRAFT_401559 [Tuber indicum]|nr:hypothetical protein HOY82DRAFT_401559 [Tuber indicum]
MVNGLRRGCLPLLVLCPVKQFNTVAVVTLGSLCWFLEISREQRANVTGGDKVYSNRAGEERGLELSCFGQVPPVHCSAALEYCGDYAGFSTRGLSYDITLFINYSILFF